MMNSEEQTTGLGLVDPSTQQNENPHAEEHTTENDLQLPAATDFNQNSKNQFNAVLQQFATKLTSSHENLQSQELVPQSSENQNDKPGNNLDLNRIDDEPANVADDEQQPQSENVPNVDSSKDTKTVSDQAETKTQGDLNNNADNQLPTRVVSKKRASFIVQARETFNSGFNLIFGAGNKNVATVARDQIPVISQASNSEQSTTKSPLSETETNSIELAKSQTNAQATDQANQKIISASSLDQKSTQSTDLEEIKIEKNNPPVKVLMVFEDHQELQAPVDQQNAPVDLEVTPTDSITQSVVADSNNPFDNAEIMRAASKQITPSNNPFDDIDNDNDNEQTVQVASKQPTPSNNLESATSNPVIIENNDKNQQQGEKNTSDQTTDQGGNMQVLNEKPTVISEAKPETVVVKEEMPTENVNTLTKNSTATKSPTRTMSTKINDMQLPASEKPSTIERAKNFLFGVVPQPKSSLSEGANPKLESKAVNSPKAAKSALSSSSNDQTNKKAPVIEVNVLKTPSTSLDKNNTAKQETIPDTVTMPAVVVVNPQPDSVVQIQSLEQAKKEAEDRSNNLVQELESLQKNYATFVTAQAVTTTESTLLIEKKNKEIQELSDELTTQKNLVTKLSLDIHDLKSEIQEASKKKDDASTVPSKPENKLTVDGSVNGNKPSEDSIEKTDPVKVESEKANKVESPLSCQFYLDVCTNPNFKWWILSAVLTAVVLAAALVIVACTVNMAALPAIAAIVAALTPVALNAVLYTAVAVAAVGVLSLVAIAGGASFKDAANTFFFSSLVNKKRLSGDYKAGAEAEAEAASLDEIYKDKAVEKTPLRNVETADLEDRQGASNGCWDSLSNPFSTVMR